MKKHLLPATIFMLLAFSSRAEYEMREHIIQRGETFEVIAKRYGITENVLKEANPKMKKCLVGMKLKVPESLITTNDTRLIAEPEKEADGPSFWDRVGQIANTVGDVVVASAEIMNEAGLLDDIGETGVVIGGTADLVNSTRGVHSNFISEATRGQMDMGEDGYMHSNSEIASASYPSNVASGDIQGLRNRLEYVNQQLEAVSTQMASLANNKLKNSYGQLAAASKSTAQTRKYQTANPSISTMKKAIKAGVKAQQPYVQNANSNASAYNRLKGQYEALRSERNSLIRRINELEGMQSDGSYAAAGYDNESASGSGNSAYYESEYRNWERRAENVYTSLSNLGLSYTTKSGEKKGTSGNTSIGFYLSAQKNLRNAQKEMARIRRDAARKGIDIPQSRWETATVSR